MVFCWLPPLKQGDKFHIRGDISYAIIWNNERFVVTKGDARKVLGILQSSNKYVEPLALFSDSVG